MADATFDGTNLIMTLPAGGAAHTIDFSRDVYSAWKRWMVDAYANQGFPPAFIDANGESGSKGGFQISPEFGIDAAAYFFMNNNQGWRIKPAEEDATIYFLGNLIPNNFDRGLIVPTTGGYTVLIDGLQPITQIAPGSVAAADVWAYAFATGNTSEEELTNARKLAQAGMGLSA